MRVCLCVCKNTYNSKAKQIFAEVAHQTVTVSVTVIYYMYVMQNTVVTVKG